MSFTSVNQHYVNIEFLNEIDQSDDEISTTSRQTLKFNLGNISLTSVNQYLANTEFSDEIDQSNDELSTTLRQTLNSN